MSHRQLPHAEPRSKVLSILWFLASVLMLFALENIWIDPWLRSKSRHIPTLVPEPQSGLWFLALLVVAISCVLLVVAQILVTLDQGISIPRRMRTGFATFFALLSCVLWFRATSGMSSTAWLQKEGKGHFVTLTWVASNSPVVGYNVYRSTKPGGSFKRINSDLIRGLTYMDQDVESGMTYYYGIRAVDAKGQESNNSNETVARIP